MGFIFQCLVAGTSLLAVIAYSGLALSSRNAPSAPVGGGWPVSADQAAVVRARGRAVILVVCAALTIAAPTLYDLNEFSRAMVGFTGLLVAPGAAVVLFLRMRDPLTELALSVAVSMAVIVLGSQILLAVDLWQPMVAFEVVVSLAAPILAWHACTAIGLTVAAEGSHARA